MLNKFRLLLKKKVNPPMLKLVFRLLMVFMALAATGSSVFAQVYSATAKLDSNAIQIGGQRNLQLKVFVPADVMQQKDKFIQWPELRDTISKQIEIVEAGKIDTALSADKKTYFLTKNLTITSFDSGYWVIPPFRFLKDGDSLKYFETQAMLLGVSTVQVNPEESIKDIKAPISVPYSLKEALPYILGLATVLALAFFVFRYFQRKNKNETQVLSEKEPELPPHMLALQKLELIREQKLWQAGQVKEYHSAVTEIVRIYLEDRFRINALEQTSDEIILSCRSLAIGQNSKMKLQQMLQLADLVKFAKTNPLPVENEMAIANAIEFVQETVPVEALDKPLVKKEAEHV